MTENVPARPAGKVPPLLWKFIVPAVTGGLVLLVTNLAHQSQIWSIMISAFVGGVTLVVQHLLDLDHGLDVAAARQTESADEVRRAINENFDRISAATRMHASIESCPIGTSTVSEVVEGAAGFSPHTPPLVRSLVTAELSSTSRFLRELSGGEATYDGEDQDWLLALAHAATATIDATSTTSVDGGGSADFLDGFWSSDLGQRYLGAQQEAARRGVVVRRLFILGRSDLARDEAFLRMCDAQTSIDIAVRVLDPAKIPSTRKSSLFDFILFDDTLSYEATPAVRIDAGARPSIVSTRLITHARHVLERRARFEELWASATPVAPSQPSTARSSHLD